MTRGNSRDLQPFDTEIDRTFYRLARHFGNLSLQSLPLDNVSLNYSEHSRSVSTYLNFVHSTDSDFIYTEDNLGQPPTVLRELAAPEFSYTFSRLV